VISQTLDKIWSSILQFSATFITPDWGALIGLLPILLVIGVVGPIVSLLALAWLRYAAKRPRRAAKFAPEVRAAALDAEGNPVYPAGEPYSPRERVIYQPGATRSASGEELVLGCPKCGLVRVAAIASCGNCGLSFTLKPTTRSLRPAGPPPGGAATA
jgi:hypothetical protein